MTLGKFCDCSVSYSNVKWRQYLYEAKCQFMARCSILVNGMFQERVRACSYHLYHKL